MALVVIIKSYQAPDQWSYMGRRRVQRRWLQVCRRYWVHFQQWSDDLDKVSEMNACMYNLYFIHVDLNKKTYNIFYLVITKLPKVKGVNWLQLLTQMNNSKPLAAQPLGGNFNPHQPLVASTLHGLEGSVLRPRVAAEWPMVLSTKVLGAGQTVHLGNIPTGECIMIM